MLNEIMLPKSIENCPIVDALVEIRFKSIVPPNAIYGIIYNSLRSEFANSENLPILQLPEPIRMSDPNLKYKPLYKISNENFVIQIGPDVISIGSHPKYVGWEVFSKTIFNVFGKIDKLNIISEVERLGIRYVNFFKENIFDNIKLEVKIPYINIKQQKTIIRTEVNQGEFASTLQVSNDATFNMKVTGSIIDIDCHKEKGLQDFFKNMTSLLQEGHQKEKELFFSLLTQKYLDTFNPKY